VLRVASKPRVKPQHRVKPRHRVKLRPLAASKLRVTPRLAASKPRAARVRLSPLAVSKPRAASKLRAAKLQLASLRETNLQATNRNQPRVVIAVVASAVVAVAVKSQLHFPPLLTPSKKRQC
jgi:hypothetical protein